MLLPIWHLSPECHDLFPFKCFLLLTEKNAQRESCELFYLGPSGDYSPGDSLSYGSEELLRRSREVSICMVLVKGGISAIKHALQQKVTVSQEEQMYLLMILLLF